MPDNPNRRRIAVITGMLSEARAAVAGTGIVCVTGYRDPDRLERGVREVEAAGGLAGIMSFGIAGALDPMLAVGDVLVAREVRTVDDQVFAVNGEWHRSLMAGLPAARDAVLAGTAGIVADGAGKTALRASTMADAVDMESQHAAAMARARGLPFAAVRVIADLAGETIPGCALVGLEPDGSTAPLAVISALALRPWQLPALLRLARNSNTALAGLAGCRVLLGGDLRFPGGLG